MKNQAIRKPTVRSDSLEAGGSGEPRVWSGGRAQTVVEVKARAARLAAGLRASGVGPGDRFAIVMRNEIAFLEATLAAAPIGAVPVPVNWHWMGSDLAHLLRDSGAKAVIAHSDLIGAVVAQAPEGVVVIEAEVPAEVADAYGLGDVRATGRYDTLDGLIASNEPISVVTDQTPMGVIYTSGTTGLPKGVLRNRISVEDQAKVLKASMGLLGLRPGGKTLLPAPLYHAAPNNHALFAAALDMDITIMPKFDPVEFLRLVESRRIESVQMVPTMFTRLLRLPTEVRKSFDVSSLQVIVHAAAPCAPETKKAIIDWFGPIVREYYGGSEVGPFVMCDSAEALAHPGTVGKPRFGSDVRILDMFTGERLPAGTPGVIYGRSVEGWPDFTYIGNDAERREIEQDGYITVGDIGYVDDDGYLYLTDRVSDMVISGGVNIYPAEIEACLMRMDGVADVAVFGIPDDEFGESLAAHIELLPGAEATAGAVRDFVATHLARYKVPRVVVFDDDLPRDDSGKLFKRRLREQYRRPTASTERHR
ncbi:AMP-binding protein [Rhodococcus sp. O3]|uniref:AMP-binding protein n=1 Tax=Rhodococcus sp. O3 TaxID=3404919 RepID=UPI003B66C43D